MFLFSLIRKTLYKLFHRFFKKQEKQEINHCEIDESLPPLQFVMDLSQVRHGQNIIAETRVDFLKRMRERGIDDIIFTPPPTPSKRNKLS
jgi:hypothetical protein